MRPWRKKFEGRKPLEHGFRRGDSPWREFFSGAIRPCTLKGRAPMPKRAPDLINLHALLAVHLEGSITVAAASIATVTHTLLVQDSSSSRVATPNVVASTPLRADRSNGVCNCHMQCMYNTPSIVHVGSHAKWAQEKFCSPKRCHQGHVHAAVTGSREGTAPL